MKFIKKLRDIYKLSERMYMIEIELNEIDEKLRNSVNEYSRQFEKRIQDMTFAYTRNLDDTKADYLKKYLEIRLDGISAQIPYAIKEVQDELKRVKHQIQELEDK